MLPPRACKTFCSSLSSFLCEVIKGLSDKVTLSADCGRLSSSIKSLQTLSKRGFALMSRCVVDLIWFSLLLRPTLTSSTCLLFISTFVTISSRFPIFPVFPTKEDFKNTVESQSHKLIPASSAGRRTLPTRCVSASVSQQRIIQRSALIPCRGTGELIWITGVQQFEQRYAFVY